MKRQLYLQEIPYFCQRPSTLTPTTEENTRIEGTRILYGLNEIIIIK
jgi:hypothetical protein